jgi:predicted metalloprotease with PDZ domain
MVRDFARHLSVLEATQGGRAVPLLQIDKTTWEAACSGRAVLVVSTLVYAFDRSVRAAFLDAERGFFNASSLCLPNCKLMNCCVSYDTRPRNSVVLKQNGRQ